ncbi:DUF2917 domain-containing protein [Paraburkholderia lycopersici]|uniref:DUF2917 domain-containing protein n=1 Tax=Paraburkholderia lycopersici TaxID=416944 RepID=A0A1G6J435_9BURK|nr:DUF2917 domain-containing protein [Paraburkholderia lycopersici]SDC13025.1 Protein of unknown function [Paraburkholderia lycopersici]
MDDALQAASRTAQASSEAVTEATCRPASPPPCAPTAHFGNEAGASDDPLPTQSVHFAVPPARTLTWRVNAPATLRIHAAQVWVTRARSPYDHWLQPGETLRLERGERIWLSTEAALPARVTITSAWRPPFASVRRGVERVAAWLALLILRRSPEA